MPISRRGFFKSAFISAVAVGIFSNSAISSFGQKGTLKDSKGYFQIPPQALGDRLFHFTRATFEPYLRSDFRVTVGPYKVVNLKLVKVEDTRPSVRKGMLRTEGECFALLFEASAELSDLQQTYVLQHEALGTFSLFLVNASEPGKAIYYQAIINHMQPPDGRTKL
ncbi:MAG TPA: hypothetical protein VER76_08645 [Pyrinomonadaceae bacterium]|nr:hypothetical protein [Pyrinomonadaceae bacterium]